MEILKQSTISFTFSKDELPIVKSILEKFYNKSEGIGFDKVHFTDNEAIVLDAMYNAVNTEEEDEL